MKKYFLFALLLGMVFLSCEEKKYSWEKDEEDINEYLKETGIEATKHSSGLYYYIEEEGTGTRPTYKDNVDVLTLGYNLDSVIFQLNTDPVRMNLSDAITGWQYGIPLFKEGGKGILILPRSLAYNTEVLVFEVELINVY